MSFDIIDVTNCSVTVYIRVLNDLHVHPLLFSLFFLKFDRIPTEEIQITFLKHCKLYRLRMNKCVQLILCVSLRLFEHFVYSLQFLCTVHKYMYVQF